MIWVVILIVVLIYFMTRKKDVYNVAYNLGKRHIDNVPFVFNKAVMFDIDDTLLFSETFKPIKPIIKLLADCKRMGLVVLIVTARDSRYTKETIQDLINIGIYPPSTPGELCYDFLYLRHSPQEDNEQFKSNVKKIFYNKGLETIMSVGDNNIDVLGDYSGYGIKLPNFRDPRLFQKINRTMTHVKVT
jgi:predicted secreted acid phosphatase